MPAGLGGHLAAAGDSPLQARRHRDTAARIPFLFNPAGAPPAGCCGRTARRPASPRARPDLPCHLALCYGLGLRAGEACGLTLGDVDAGRSLLIVRGGKFGKSRLVPHGPRIAALVSEHAARRARAGICDAQAPLFTFDGRRRHPGTASQAFHQLWPPWGCRSPRGLAAPAA